MTAQNQADGAVAYVDVHVGDESDFNEAIDSLVEDNVMSRIRDQDASLWGPEAAEEASIRLAWTNLHHTARSLVGEVEALREEFHRNGLDRVVLCGMGGSSLAPEVICRTAGAELTVLDSSHPDYVRRVIEDRLERSIVVISSKSGTTVETISHKRAFEHAFEQAGLDPVDHLVIITDPGTTLAQNADRSGYRLFTAEPYVGGRYSALTAFGLVPSGLAGADISALLDQAAAIAPKVSADNRENPAARLGAFLAAAHNDGADKVVLADAGSQSTGLPEWIEQLIAESTGKAGRGMLPVIVTATDPPTDLSHDEAVVLLGGTASSTPWSAGTDAGLGAALLMWEYAIAVSGRLIGINPFDQPDVESAKEASRQLLGDSSRHVQPDFTQGNIDVYIYQPSSPNTAGDEPVGNDTAQTTIADAISWLLDQMDPVSGYLAVHAYLDRGADAAFAGIRDDLAQRTHRPVTFGWGPRFLHSTGQYHKGGPPTGAFLQIISDPVQDLDIPGRQFTFGSFIESQAGGDAAVLTDLGRPVLQLHLHDTGASLSYLSGVLA